MSILTYLEEDPITCTLKRGALLKLRNSGTAKPLTWADLVGPQCDSPWYTDPRGIVLHVRDDAMNAAGFAPESMATSEVC